MHDYHLDEGVMEKTLHLMIIIPLLNNMYHLFNASGEIVGDVKHSDSSEAF